MLELIKQRKANPPIGSEMDLLRKVYISEIMERIHKR